MGWLAVLAAVICLMAWGGVSQAQPGPEASAYFVEAVVDRDEVYVGQQVVYSFRLYTTVSLPQGEYLPPSFAGFWRSDMGPVSSAVTQVNGTFYTMTQLETALFPLVTGNTVIDPAFLVFPATVFRDAETLSTAAIDVRVLPLPDGAPEGFGGAVGVFSASAAFDRPQTTVREPVTLRLTVRGTGNVEQLPPPQIPLPSGWGAYAARTGYRAEVKDGLLVGEKTFEWVVTAEQSGTQTLGPITMPYFDPDAGAYRSVTTESLTLEVLPGTMVMPDVPVSAGSDTEADQMAVPALALKRVSGAIAMMPTPNPAWLLWVAPVALVASVWLWTRRVRRNRVGNAARRAGALARAKRALRAIQRQTDPDPAGSQVVVVVQTYIADKLGQESAVVTHEELAAALHDHDVDATVVAQLMACLAMADQARFAPADPSLVPSLLERTGIALSKVDAQWRSD